jgi:hypothetical protein
MPGLVDGRIGSLPRSLYQFSLISN